MRLTPLIGLIILVLWRANAGLGADRHAGHRITSRIER